MARNEHTVVETFALRTPTRNPDGSINKFPPQRLPRQPVPRVKGAHGSDEAKREAKRKLTALGYKVTYVGFSETALMVYVTTDEPKPRKPRSATSRLGR